MRTHPRLAVVFGRHGREAALLAVLGGPGCYGGLGFGGDEAGGGAGGSGQEDGASAGSGGSGSGDEGGGAEGSDGEGGSGGTGGGEALDPGPIPFHRLTADEYANTIRDLSYGRVLVDPDGLPADGIAPTGFTTDLTVSQAEVDALLGMALEIGPALTTALREVHPCDPAGGQEEACARDFVERVGPRAYRRPLDAQEIDGLVAHYGTVRAELGYDHADGLRVLTQTMISSPSFLYRWELGFAAPEVEGELVKLSDYEVASRLSYFLWRSMPDDALFAAAAAGELGSVSVLADQAERMLGDAKATGTLDEYFVRWMGIADVAEAQKDGGKYPDFTPELASDLAEETRQFVRHVMIEGDGSLTTLLGADFTFVNERTAALYGISGVVGEDFQKVTLGPERAGLFTQPSFLAATGLPSGTSPPRRGKFVLEHVMCRPVPPPPPDLDITPPAPVDGQQTREIFEQHSTDPQCSGCHSVLDPVGFAFEAYDAVGAWREEEAGRPIDSSGTLAGLGSFDNGAELMRLLAGREDVGACSTKYWYRYMLGRVETAGEKDRIAEAAVDLAAADFDLRGLLVAIASHPSFLFRAPSEGETL